MPLTLSFLGHVPDGEGRTGCSLELVCLIGRSDCTREAGEEEGGRHLRAGHGRAMGGVDMPSRSTIRLHPPSIGCMLPVLYCSRLLGIPSPCSAPLPDGNSFERKHESHPTRGSQIQQAKYTASDSGARVLPADQSIGVCYVHVSQTRCAAPRGPREPPLPAQNWGPLCCPQPQPEGQVRGGKKRRDG